VISEAAYEAPLFTFQGDLNPIPDDLVAPRVAVVWVDPAGLRDDVPEPAEDTKFDLTPAGYTFSIFAPPPASAIREIVDPSSGLGAASFAFGEIVLFEDLNGDGTFQITSLAEGSEIVPSDVYRGAQVQYVVIYIEKPWSAATGPAELVGLLSSTPGYHLGHIDCSVPDAPATSIPAGNPPVEITVLPTATSQLPFLRSCLRSHPATTTSDGSQP
jgi:hypothetical protein